MLRSTSEASVNMGHLFLARGAVTVNLVSWGSAPERYVGSTKVARSGGSASDACAGFASRALCHLGSRQAVRGPACAVTWSQPAETLGFSGHSPVTMAVTLTEGVTASVALM